MEVMPIKIEIFQDEKGKEPFSKWVLSLSSSFRARVFARLDRMEIGNFGDFKSIGEGLFELRLFFGAGYRIYYGNTNNKLILLLCGGDKSSQKKDISIAKTYWKTYKEKENII